MSFLFSVQKLWMQWHLFVFCSAFCFFRVILCIAFRLFLKYAPIIMCPYGLRQLCVLINCMIHFNFTSWRNHIESVASYFCHTLKLVIVADCDLMDNNRRVFRFVSIFILSLNCIWLQDLFCTFVLHVFIFCFSLIYILSKKHIYIISNLKGKIYFIYPVLLYLWQERCVELMSSNFITQK